MFFFKETAIESTISQINEFNTIDVNILKKLKLRTIFSINKEFLSTRTNRNILTNLTNKEDIKISKTESISDESIDKILKRERQNLKQKDEIIQKL